MAHYLKDPDANLDYAFDWSAELAANDPGDTITAATVTSSAPTDLEVSDVSHTDTTVTYWLSGGEADSNYTVTCRITTAAGRVDDRTDTIQVRQR